MKKPGPTAQETISTQVRKPQRGEMILRFNSSREYFAPSERKFVWTFTWALPRLFHLAPSALGRIDLPPRAGHELRNSTG
jgi:hypothetical protein